MAGKKSNPKSPESKAKTEKANAEYESKINKCVERKLLTEHSDINDKGFPHKCVSTLEKYISKCILLLKEQNPSVNPFPSDKFKQLDEKTPSVKKSSSKAPPKQKKLPSKKGSVQETVNEVDEETKEVETKEVETKEVETKEVEDVENSEVDTSETKSSEKKPSKKLIVSISKPVGLMLQQLCNRFVGEVYQTSEGKKTTEKEFLTFLLNNDSADFFKPQFSRFLVSAVDRCLEEVNDLSNNGFESVIHGYIKDMFEQEKREKLSQLTSEYFNRFMKLLALYLSNTIWHDHQQITIGVLSSVISNMYVGMSNKVGLDFLTESVMYCNVMNPPLTEEQKKERNEKRKAKKPDATADVTEEPSDEPEEPSDEPEEPKQIKRLITSKKSKEAKETTEEPETTEEVKNNKTSKKTKETKEVAEEPETTKEVKNNKASKKTKETKEVAEEPETTEEVKKKKTTKKVKDSESSEEVKPKKNNKKTKVEEPSYEDEDVEVTDD